MAIGYIAALDEALASVMIASNGVAPLVDALCNEQEDHVKSACAWSVGQMGRHSPIHATAVAEASALPHLVSAFLSPTASEDLQNKCKRALKAITEHLTHFPSLNALLQVILELPLQHVSLSNSLFFEESQQPHQLSAFRSFTVRSR
jgi:hypothetical protein